MTSTGTSEALTWTADTLGDRLNVKSDDRERVFKTAVAHLERAFAGAYRTVPVEVLDDCLLRVAQAIKDAARQPAAGGAQLTTDGQQAARAPRDPVTAIQPIVAQYVVAL